jgi:hypothetical protein
MIKEPRKMKINRVHWVNRIDDVLVLGAATVGIKNVHVAFWVGTTVSTHMGN